MRSQCATDSPTMISESLDLTKHGRADERRHTGSIKG